jgi:hypothetical protein
VRVLEPALPLLDLGAEAGHLLEHERVLLRDPVDRVHAAEHVVEARRAEQNCERGILAVVHVELDDPSRELTLRALEALLRDREALCVRAQVVLDPVEPDVREVVGLDGSLEARVELADLAEHALGLGLLRRD